MHDALQNPQTETGFTPPAGESTGDVGSFCVCPVCGGGLMEIRHKLVCSQCHAICETCCEGGRG
jgi:hypothetical protein